MFRVTLVVQVEVTDEKVECVQELLLLVQLIRDLQVVYQTHPMVVLVEVELVLLEKTHL
jgi:hypothetical protein